VWTSPQTSTMKTRPATSGPFLDEARDPGQIKPGAIVVAGDQDAAAVCEVIGLTPAGDGTIVHLRLLQGLAEDYPRSRRTGPGQLAPFGT
jgi:hypothetical protein